MQDCSLLSAATFPEEQPAGDMRLLLSNGRQERVGQMLGPRRGAQACLQQIWNSTCKISSMESVSSKSEYESDKVCCTRFGTICRVYCIRM
jgi:hypothetical protein